VFQFNKTCAFSILVLYVDLRYCTLSSGLGAFEDGTDRVFEMSAYKIQTPGNYPEESIQHSEHGVKV